jgi:hypothetical protein
VAVRLVERHLLPQVELHPMEVVLVAVVGPLERRVL